MNGEEVSLDPRERQTHMIDRTNWSAGPWDSEPDRLEWRTAAGLPGLILRNHHGALCGYVAVPPGHPCHGTHYDAVDVDVHGGLTYAAACRGPICHVPQRGEPDDVWWFGFDCLHHCDTAPGHEAMNRAIGMPTPPDLLLEQRYWTIDAVTAEVESLAEQLTFVRRTTEVSPR